MNCEITGCHRPRACGFYCKAHHKAICVDGASPKEVAKSFREFQAWKREMGL